uniref:Uncharacterized protein n=1 Tax=Aegilops tauschii subsp. strangulata TaxID=200361 RepID=A0A452XIU9_AEGTS
RALLASKVPSSALSLRGGRVASPALSVSQQSRARFVASASAEPYVKIPHLSIFIYISGRWGRNLCEACISNTELQSGRHGVCAFGGELRLDVAVLFMPCVCVSPL